MSTAEFETPSKKFKFIAFDQKSGVVLAYGQKAIDALYGADIIGPTKTIEILPTGRAGNYIWRHKIPLAEAKLLLSQNTQP